MKYNNSDKWERLKSIYYDKKLQWDIKNNYNLNINLQKNNVHIIGTKEYQRELLKRRDFSILTIDSNRVQEIINEYAGNGLIQRRNGIFANKELVILNDDIGYVIDITGVKTDTNRAYIHYSKTGAHLVPTLKGSDNNAS